MHHNEFLFNKTNRRNNFPNLFCQETLHVSGISSAHHQEFSTVHSALVYVIQVTWQIPVSNVQRKTPDDGQRKCPKHVDFLSSILPPWSCLKAVVLPAWQTSVPNVQRKTPDDGQTKCPKHVVSWQNKFGKLVRLLVLLKRKQNRFHTHRNTTHFLSL